jgi:hypothetical protein
MFKYPKNKENRPVFILLYNPQTRDIISIKTNIKTIKAQETYLYKA